jgi:D-glycero-beta-D-manno-heptose-7-phosphate kinase
MGRNTAHLIRLVRRMRGRRLAVLGDWMLDRYIWGSASRLSPEAAVPVVDFIQQSECLGGAGNVAANLAALGARVSVYGVAGADEPGRALGVCLRAIKISATGLFADPKRPTTVKTRIIARHQQVVRMDSESRAPLRKETEQKMLRLLLPSIRNLDGLIISDYDKGVVTDSIASEVLEACRRAHVPTFVKPKWSRLPSYRGANVIVVNRAEAGFLTQRALGSDDAVEAAGRALLAHFSCKAVVITRGEEGISVFERSSKAGFHAPATSQERHFGQTGRDQNARGRQVFDVTGAGDTVLTGIALAMAAGANVREAAFLGNAAAGIVVGKLGTATLTPDELVAAIRETDVPRG